MKNKLTPEASKYIASVDGRAHQSAVEIITRLERALAESVKLQSHYAELLNMHDGGQRMTFTVESWLERLDHAKGGE